MANVGALIAELGANYANLQKDMDKAVAIMNSSQARMNAHLDAIDKKFRSVNTTVGAFIAGFVANMARRGVQSSLEFAESIDKVAKASGLSTDAVQQFRFAMQQNGASAEQADKSLENFANTIGDAANGSQKAQLALARVGVTFDDLKSKSVEQLFGKATDTLSKFGSAADATNAKVDVFGKQAKEMGGALSIAATEMNRLRDAARAAGAVLSEETITKAKQTKDEMDKLTLVIGVQLTKAFVDLGPAIVRGTKFLADFAEMASFVMRRLGLTDAMNDEERYDDLLRQRLDIMDRMAQLKGGGNFIDALVGASSAEEVAKLTHMLTLLDHELDVVRKRMAAPPPPKPADKPAADKVKNSDEYTAYLEQITKATQQANIALITDEESAARMRNNIQYNEFLLRAQRLGVWVDQNGVALTEQQKQVQAYFEYWRQQAEKAAQAQNPIRRLLMQWTDDTAQMKRAAADWLNDASERLTDFVMTGKLQFRDFANSVIRDLVRIRIQKAIAGVGDIFLGGGGAGEVTAADVGSAAEFGFFAAGGRPTPGEPYVVGENGPEIRIDDGPGTIIPNGKIGNMGRGGNTYVIDARGADAGAVDRIERALYRLAGPGVVERRAIASVTEASLRGGPVGSAFGR